jgi:hypothetical protein
MDIAVAHIQTLREEAAEHKKAIRHHRNMLRMKMERIRQYEVELHKVGIKLEIGTKQKGVGASHGQRTPP